jgi:hypothetical protein
LGSREHAKLLKAFYIGVSAVVGLGLQLCDNGLWNYDPLPAKSDRLCAPLKIANKSISKQFQEFMLVEDTFSNGIDQILNFIIENFSIFKNLL